MLKFIILIHLQLALTTVTFQNIASCKLALKREGAGKVRKVPWKVGSLQLFGSLPKYNSYFPKYCKLQINIKEGMGWVR